MASQWLGKVIFACLLILATGHEVSWTRYRQDLSDICFNIVSAEAKSCPSGLLLHASNNFEGASQGHWRESRNQLCAQPCYQNLIELRNKIWLACTDSLDVLKDGDIIYSATFLVDRALYYWDISCLRDPNTGRLCDTTDRQRWDEPDSSDSARLCTDCCLENWKIHLQSPFGYSEQLAQEFDSATSRCKATLYELVTPTAYTVGSPTATQKSEDESIAWDSTIKQDAHDHYEEGDSQEGAVPRSCAGPSWADL